jgi:tRNA G26 N,N-dimethylase Trm1
MVESIVPGPKLLVVDHPFLKNHQMLIPKNYKFHNSKGEEQKFKTTYKLAKELAENQSNGSSIVIDAFAGAGALSMIYQSLGYGVIAIEKDEHRFYALTKNLGKQTKNTPGTLIYRCNNNDVLSKRFADDPNVKIIDLDPYSDCAKQIVRASRILKEGLLFITTGDIRSVLQFRNPSFVSKRYHNTNFKIKSDQITEEIAENYIKKVLYKYIEREFEKQRKEIELIDYFWTIQMCRMCIKVG